MKLQKILPCFVALLLTGCSTLSSVHWSAAAPWNWFSASLEVSETGLGSLTASTPLEKAAVASALGSDYRVREGMKIESGQVVRYFEALRDEKLAVIIDGENGSVNHIEVLDDVIATDKGITVGTPFSSLYDKAFGNCHSVSGPGIVSCKAPGSRHVNLIFSGDWKGPEGLIPPDESLSKWSVERIIWQD